MHETPDEFFASIGGRSGDVARAVEWWDPATHIAEEAVLGAALLLGAGPWPAEMEALVTLDFSTVELSEIWDAIVELREAGIAVEEVSVCAKLAEFGETAAKPELVCRLAWQTPTAVNAGHWARLVGETGRGRRLRARLKDAADNAVSVADLTREATEAMRHVEPDSRAGLRPASKLAPLAMLGLQERVKNPDAGRIAWTGLTDLDRTLRLEAGDLTIIAGRPSMGKTALAANVADRCGDPRESLGCVAFFSLEMTAESLILRVMQRTARSSRGDLVGAIRNGTGEALVNRTSMLRLYVDDRGGLSLNQLRSALSRMGRVRLVVVDYLQLMRLGDDRKLRHDQLLGQLTKGLKGLAKEFGCHVIALSQLNRSVEKRTPPIPLLSDLRDSGNLEEDADNVVMPFRPEYYDEDGERGIAYLYIRKQRKGQTGQVRVAWVKERQSFEDLAQ